MTEKLKQTGSHRQYVDKLLNQDVIIDDVPGEYDKIKELKNTQIDTTLNSQEHLDGPYKDKSSAAIEVLIDAMKQQQIDGHPINVELPSEGHPFLDITNTKEGFTYESFKEKIDMRDPVKDHIDYDKDTQTGGSYFESLEPLSFIDELFFITTRDGITSHIRVFKKNGTPEFELIKEGKEGRPNGTTSRIPIKEEHQEAIRDIVKGVCFSLEIDVVFKFGETVGPNDYRLKDNAESERKRERTAGVQITAEDFELSPEFTSVRTLTPDEREKLHKLYKAEDDMKKKLVKDMMENIHKKQSENK